MIPDIVKTIYKSIQPSQLETTLKGITSFHRIQASKGFHDAAAFCTKRLNEMGIDARILSYPAKEGISFQNSPSFDFWECQKAWCILEQTGECIADYEKDPFSIIQRSGPWMNPETPIEIINLNKGVSEKEYEGIDFHNKIVFVHDEYSYVRDWAIEKRGAIGYISDYVEPETGIRDRESMHDIKKYTSFWWRPGQKRVFGFVLSPDDGDRLNQLCLDIEKEGKRPTVRCYVNSSLHEGNLELVSALIPGESTEEILLVAHLCHPMSSANDNASGATAVMEALCTISNLLKNHGLDPLKRSIRILLVPEILGSYAYLDSLSPIERARIKLALTLDMVGGKQDGGRGPLTIFETPHCTPSIGNPLAIAILNILKQDIPALNQTDHISLFNYAVNEFIDGSDHGLLNDPILNISSPLLCQWPDKTYHTSGDTIDTIDYKLLQHSCALAAAYAYCAATLSIDDLPLLIQTNYQRMTDVVTNLALTAYEQKMEKQLFQRVLVNYIHYYTENIRSVICFYPEKYLTDAQLMIQRESKRIQSGALLAAGIMNNEDMQNLSLPAYHKNPSFQYIPKRNFFGRLDYGFGWICATRKDGFPSYSNYKKKVSNINSYDMEINTIYYINGLRTLAEIADLVFADCRENYIEQIDAFVRLLADADLVSIKEVNP